MKSFPTPEKILCIGVQDQAAKEDKEPTDLMWELSDFVPSSCFTTMEVVGNIVAGLHNIFFVLFEATMSFVHCQISISIMSLHLIRPTP